ncbi:hypothetical protein Moror_5303 [Moniliophthora roreri MCA 2997]|uniref:F-box domain-containing protein n=1 Tax=Moniliophthora roreri (strain MCA 2997) TaxID=1381753 RepID=V2WQG8_MONRO|nr:hypothetical protein Moror_5303 [Moniliophthora roreri MCA 2997]
MIKDLPIEIWDDILQNSPPKVLRSLRLVSRRFSEISVKHLYREICLNDSITSIRYVAFLRTNTRAAHAVQRLKIDYKWFCTVDDSQVLIPRLISRTISHLPCLRHLIIYPHILFCLISKKPGLLLLGSIYCSQLESFRTSFRPCDTWSFATKHATTLQHLVWVNLSHIDSSAAFGTATFPNLVSFEGSEEITQLFLSSATVPKLRQVTMLLQRLPCAADGLRLSYKRYKGNYGLVEEISLRLPKLASLNIDGTPAFLNHSVVDLSRFTKLRHFQWCMPYLCDVRYSQGTIEVLQSQLHEVGLLGARCPTLKSCKLREPFAWVQICPGVWIPNASQRAGSVIFDWLRNGLLLRNLPELPNLLSHLDGYARSMPVAADVLSVYKAAAHLPISDPSRRISTLDLLSLGHELGIWCTPDFVERLV